MAILLASSVLSAPICEWIYIKKVSPVQRPIFIMSEPSTPWSLSAMASRRSERMSRRTLEVIALGHKVGVMGSLLDKGGDIGGNNMYVWANEAQWGVVGAAFWDNAEDAARQSFDRAAKPPRACHVVNSPLPFAIILIIHPESDRVSLRQFKE
jgi:hypothetical protein